MNIAVFGGSFDPPHKGHDAVVRAAISNLNIDKLIVVPAFFSPFKDGTTASATQRWEWCKRLWGALPKVEVWDYEVKANRPVRTIETVQRAIEFYEPDTCYLLIGADQLENLNKWFNFQTLASLVTFVVATREGIKVPSSMLTLDINEPTSSTKVRAGEDFAAVPAAILDEAMKIYKK